MSQATEAVSVTSNSVVSPMISESPSTKATQSILDKTRDSSRKYPPNYADICTEDQGKEVVPVAEGKQVQAHDGIEYEPPVEGKYIVLPRDEQENIHSAPEGPEEEEQRREDRRCCGFTLKKVVIFVVTATLLVVALGVGLPLGLKKSSKKIASGHRGSGSANQPFLTGIDYDDPFENEGSGVDPLTDLYYQRKDGLIRQATMLVNGTWLAAAADDIVATDAKIGTPIAVTSITVRINQVMAQSRHLFYIDTKGTLRERVYDNITNNWSSGALDQLKVKPVSGSSLQACDGTDFAGERNNTSYRDGITVFYGYTEDSIQQLGWNMEDKFWVKEQTFVDVNGKGGVACHIRPGLSTVVATNKTDVIFFWRDSNVTKRGSATHPINVWQKAPISIPGIHEGAAINMRAYGFGQFRNRVGGSNNSTRGSSGRDSRPNWRYGNWTPNRYILTQLSDLTIRAFNITGSAENMTVAPISYRTTQVPSVAIGSPPAKALPGTRLSFTMDRNAIELGSGGRNSTRRTWITWFQTEAGGIGQYIASNEHLDRWAVGRLDIGE
ncbi:hypothetical protein FKW77_004456 [Venturia effusa]|uniref:Fucose-specific lectin n=1 Tax=Venturia effusa TaxID=50376 RepID=A0A517L771_9PEZI|nr:hypothetical protein FKW77_004456 [Venturia effusa]